MCGIAGLLEFDVNPPVDADVLERMAGALDSRGPDGRGFLREPGIGLAHTRLSIIDLEGGAQPIANEDGSVWTVFNGEIFNYPELREALEGRGHRFRTRTDTEVLVHLYEDYGLDFVHHLNGQFALAIWDGRNRRLVLARDRPGILPLFFHEGPDRLAFASEVKGLLPALPSRPSLNPSALDQIFTFWAPTSPETVFEGVFEVGPGELLVVEDGRLRRRRYWEWDFPAPGDHRTDRDERLADELHELLFDSVRIRLRADVPVGAYLSGGLDSSAIAALVQADGATRQKTFSISFEDPALDEHEHQERVRRHLGSEHSSVSCSGRDIARALPHAVWRTETPILRMAPVPMKILSGLVRGEGYKVVLTGEGADEVLGGYDLFKESKIRQFWARHPESTMRASLLRRLYPYLELNQRQSSAYLRRFFGQALETPDLPHFSHVPRWSTTARIKDFYAEDFKAHLRDDAIEGFLAGASPGLRSWHPFDRAQYIEARTLMAGYLLCSQGDRMLMANSVEGRFPFLDHRIIEFANRLHPRHRMRGLREKALLKRAIAPYLPRETVERFKQPYRAPDIAAFFGSGPPPDFVEDALGPERIGRAGYFDADRVERLMKKIRAGRAIGAKDNMAFVGILTTQLWHQTFVEASLSHTEHHAHAVH